MEDDISVVISSLSSFDFKLTDGEIISAEGVLAGDVVDADAEGIFIFY